MDAVEGRSFNERLKLDLEHLASRGYTEGFLSRHRHDGLQNFEYGYSKSDSQQFVGEVLRRTEDGLLEIDVKNKFLTGDEIELMTPKGNKSFILEHMQTRKGEEINDAKGSGHIVQIKCDTDLDVEYGIIMRYLNDGENTRHPFAQNQDNAKAAKA